MSEAVRRLVKEAWAVVPICSNETARRFSAAIRAVEAELPALTVMSKDEFMSKIDDLNVGENR